MTAVNEKILKSETRKCNPRVANPAPYFPRYGKLPEHATHVNDTDNSLSGFVCNFWICYSFWFVISLARNSFSSRFETNRRLDPAVHCDFNQSTYERYTVKRLHYCISVTDHM
jgi:hypothetical protein